MSPAEAVETVVLGTAVGLTLVGLYVLTDRVLLVLGCPWSLAELIHPARRAHPSRPDLPRSAVPERSRSSPR